MNMDSQLQTDMNSHLEDTAQDSDDSWWTVSDAVVLHDTFDDRALSALFTAVETAWSWPCQPPDEEFKLQHCSRDDTETIHVYLDPTCILESDSQHVPLAEVIKEATIKVVEQDPLVYLYVDDEGIPVVERMLLVESFGMDTTPLRKVFHDTTPQRYCEYVTSPILERNGNPISGRRHPMPWSSLVDDLQACQNLTYHELPLSPVNLESFQAYSNAVFHMHEYNCRATALYDTERSKHNELILRTPSPEIIREELQERYKALKRSLAQERAEIRARLLRAEVAGNETELKRLQDTKHRLNRLVIDECTSGLLRDSTAPFLFEQSKQANDIEQLSVLHDAQRMMLKADDFEFTDACEFIEATQDQLNKMMTKWIDAAEDSLQLLDFQMSASNMLVRKMSTRTHRLAALDVTDPEERWEEVQRRLLHKDASQLMLKTVDNMNAVQETMSNSVKHIRRIEESLSNLVAPVLDIYTVLRDCRLVSIIRMPEGGRGTEIEVDEDSQNLQNSTSEDGNYEDAQEYLEGQTEFESAHEELVT
ncbi:hypothetical protein NA57DRAFT_70039 [Rhizodiscina lignyota]|uniref:Uncharacterized protein n=1 Tax=Rhizodiscina lignyota TaxID=1504668 RepID=A0A9P4IR41_9PEZI|nr:hypothetical protein NA57DRAFT_70039 [Rhizodiscina lignyota]